MKLGKEALTRFASLAWAAWFCKNRVVFEGDTRLDTIRIATRFVRYNVEYKVYNAQVCMPVVGPSRTLVATWQPPSTSCVNVNVDAHVSQGNGVSFGCVIRDANGALKAAGVKRV